MVNVEYIPKLGDFWIEGFYTNIIEYKVLYGSKFKYYWNSLKLIIINIQNWTLQKFKTFNIHLLAILYIDLLKMNTYWSLHRLI